MKIAYDPTRRPTRSWAILLGALILSGGVLLVMRSGLARDGHHLSATRYAALSFNGLVRSNGLQYGIFTIANRHQHPLSFGVNNVEILTRQGWRYYASWSPGGPDPHPVLGPLSSPLATAASHTFLVPSPAEGDAWRIHVGVLRGFRGLTLKDRAAVLFRTLSPAAALTSNARLTAGYRHFTHAGMLDGPSIPSTSHP